MKEVFFTPRVLMSMSREQLVEIILSLEEAVNLHEEIDNLRVKTIDTYKSSLLEARAIAEKMRGMSCTMKSTN